MENFKEINIDSFILNPFKKIGKDWMLITAENNGITNAMTASWGGLGVMWGKNVAYTAIRPQRYTKNLIDNSDNFSLCFFDDTYKDILTYFGTVSGKTENKIEKSNMKILSSDNTPFFKESKLVFICQKLYAQDINPCCFIDNSLDNKWYTDKDYHCIYISEIKKVLLRQ